ncbi:hypothetical protein ACPYIV_14515 [Parabacteroides sp. ASD2025]|uniref:hypothetical protein n=1 Tax=Parabacteroides sp. ASD2025 TaxID=3415987 RepID=UPI003CF22F7B
MKIDELGILSEEQFLLFVVKIQHGSTILSEQILDADVRYLFGLTIFAYHKLECH